MKKTILNPILIAVVLGVVTMAMLIAGFLIPWGTLMTDPREIPLTLGAALTGPLGIVILAIFNFIGNLFSPLDAPISVFLADALAHAAAMLLFSIVYSKVIYKIKMPWRLVGWAAGIWVYYFVFMYPIGGIVFYWWLGMIPTPFYLFQNPPWAEIILTCIVTTLIMVALPKGYHRPVWYDEAKSK